MTDLEYRFLWNAKEHQRFYRALQRESRRGSKLWLGLYAWWVFLGLIGLVAVIGARDSAGVRVGAEILAFLVVWLVFDRVAAPYFNARAYARDHAACIPNDQVRLITREGLTAQCTISTASVKWDGIVKVTETPDFFLFMTTPKCAIQLPKRAVQDTVQLRTWLRQATRAQTNMAVRLSD